MKKLLSLCMILSLLLSHIAFAGTSLETLLENGGTYAVNGEFQKAEAAFDIALKLAPGDIRVYSALKHMYLLKGDLKSALEALDTAVSLAPSEGELYLEKAKILFDLGRINEAEQALVYAEVLDSYLYSDASLWKSAFCAYYENDNYNKVIDAYRILVNNGYSPAEEDLQKLKRALILTGQTAEAEKMGLISLGEKDTILEGAIQSGKKISLVPAEKESLRDYPVFMSLEAYNLMCEEYPGEAPVLEPADDGLRVKIPEEYKSEIFGDEADLENLSPIAVSPSGNARLYFFEDNPFLVKNKEITLIAPNKQRSAPLGETGEKQMYQAIRYLSNSPERNGIVWSKDEQYFILSYPMRTLQAANYLDLMFVDAKTGDFILANRTPKSGGDEGFEGVLFACFDDEGENIYYIAFVSPSTHEFTNMLKKYNIETGTVESLCGYEKRDIHYPGMYFTEYNTIKAIFTPISVNQNAGVIEFKGTDDGWTYEKDEFSASCRYQSPREYHLSENSGMEVALSKINNTIGYLSVRNQELGAPGMDQMILLPVGENQGYAKSVAEEMFGAEAPIDPDDMTLTQDFERAWAGYFANASSTKNTSQPTYSAPKYISVQNMILSPDGYFALMLISYPEINPDYDMLYTIKPGLCLIDLETLRFTQIELPEGITLSNNNIGFVWNQENEIMLPATDGTVYNIWIG